MKRIKSQLKSFKKQRGNMVLQAAVAIGVGAIVTLGAMKGFTYYQDAKAGNEVNELSQLKTATVKYGQALGGAFTSTNVTLAQLAGMNFWPKNSVSGAGATLAVTNQWGGDVSVAVGTANNAGDSIAFTYTSLPTNACKNIVAQTNDIAAKVTVGTTAVKAVGAQVDNAALATACDAAADNATVIYTVSR